MEGLVLYRHYKMAASECSEGFASPDFSGFAFVGILESYFAGVDGLHFMGLSRK